MVSEIAESRGVNTAYFPAIGNIFPNPGKTAADSPNGWKHYSRDWNAFIKPAGLSGGIETGKLTNQ